ncbi:hypothetical protein M0R45_019754 [Rubus argutus]|uniref:Uncharacterized protein n=1 Tax=Rubus argutus TaxID=59490 RepID=A0AAW1X8S1_RUBAR
MLLLALSSSLLSLNFHSSSNMVLANDNFATIVAASYTVDFQVRLDVASKLALSTYFINYKFVNVLSSPSAVFLDVVAIRALVIYISLVVLGYIQTCDRYQVSYINGLFWYRLRKSNNFGSRTPGFPMNSKKFGEFRNCRMRSTGGYEA